MNFDKTTYGAETLSHIYSYSNLILDGTRVAGSVEASGSINARNVTAKTMESGGDSVLFGTACEKIKAGGTCVANQCTNLGLVKANKIEIDSCKNITAIEAASTLILNNSCVKESVKSGEIYIKLSSIEGTIICSHTSCEIVNSTAKDIYFRKNHSISISFGNITNSKIVVSGSSFSWDSDIHNQPLFVSSRPQQLKLISSTVMSITFEEGNGEVFLDSTSKINGILQGCKVKE